MSERPDERSIPVHDAAVDRTATSRRRLLQAAVAAGGVVALGDLAAAQEAEAIELGGETSGWQGVAPDDIADETNPTLELEAGTTYELTWENLDGQPHNFVIESDEGEELERTELLTGQGETQTLEFEATEEMAEYYCEPHSATMRGEISIGDGGAAADEEEAEEATDDEAAFFDPGAEIGLRRLAEGMTAPTDFAALEDGRYLVADQTGELWSVTDEGLQDEPFLDVSDRLVELGTFEGDYADPEQDYDERGLLGVEPHPEFAENGRLFVHYSAPPNDETPEGWSHVEVVSEFQADEDLESVDPDSERVLMEFQKPQYNHDAGPMAFGPDGYLYVPMGDGGGANDDMEGHVDDWYDDNDGGNGQDVSENLLGGVHRIDVDGETSETSRDGGGEVADDGGDDERPYGIPEDNPLVDEEDALDEYYAWGFRNPFGVSFDSEGRLFVSDAGQDLFEEANLVEAGGNYGWNVKEGTHCFSTESPSQPPEDCPDTAPDEPPYNGQELQDPIVEYPHVYEDQVVGITIIGGHVYEAGDVEELDGKYVFGDWTADPARAEPAGRLLAASEPDEGDDEPEDEATDEADEVVPRDELWDMEELQVADSEDGSFPYFVRQFGQDSEGNVYVLANRAGVPEGDTGAVFEIVPPGEGDSLEPPEEDEEGEPPEEEEATEAEAEEATEDVQDEPIDENETETTDNESETDDLESNETTDGGNDTLEENATDTNVTDANATAGDT